MKLHYFPPSSYSQKGLMACLEKGVRFERVIVPMFDPDARAAFGKLSPLGKVPLLERDDGSFLPETSVIIEYLDRTFATRTRLIPEHLPTALQARLYDRWFDLYVNEPMTVLFHGGRRPPEQRDQNAMAEARAMLDKIYPVLDAHFRTSVWAAGDVFSLAECAAAPALRYCEMVHPLAAFNHLSAYWARLAARPSYVRVMEEAAPFLAKLTGG
jgi:glutathione S-transferase